MSELIGPVPVQADIMENPLLIEQRENRDVITSLQAEQRQLMERIGEIKIEIQERWQTDQRLGMEIRGIV